MKISTKASEGWNEQIKNMQIRFLQFDVFKLHIPQKKTEKASVSYVVSVEISSSKLKRAITFYQILNWATSRASRSCHGMLWFESDSSVI